MKIFNKKTEKQKQFFRILHQIRKIGGKSISINRTNLCVTIF